MRDIGSVNVGDILRVRFKRPCRLPLLVQWDGFKTPPGLFLEFAGEYTFEVRDVDGTRLEVSNPPPAPGMKAEQDEQVWELVYDAARMELP